MKKSLLVCFLFFFFTNLSFANDELLLIDKQKTIKELKTTIDGLDKVKTDLIIKTEEFSLDYDLKSFLKENLSVKDNLLLTKLISDFNIKKSELEDKLLVLSKNFEDTSEIYKELITLRKNFYNSALLYVEPLKSDNYLYYVNELTNNYIDEIGLDSDIVQKTEIVHEKISNIEEKIKEHKNYIEETLSTLLNSKIDERIKILENDSNFAKLDIQGKKEVIDSIIIRIKEMKIGFTKSVDNLELPQSVRTTSAKKAEICEHILKRFDEYKLNIN